MTNPNRNFVHLLRSIETLIRIGNEEGAEVMIECAEGQIAPSATGMCPKCIARRDRQLEALRQAKVHLRE